MPTIDIDLYHLNHLINEKLIDFKGGCKAAAVGLITCFDMVEPRGSCLQIRVVTVPVGETFPSRDYILLEKHKGRTVRKISYGGIGEVVLPLAGCAVDVKNNRIFLGTLDLAVTSVESIEVEELEEIKQR